MRIHFRHPRSKESVEWRCTGTATFEDMKAAADRMLSAEWPFEQYFTDCFRRDDDKKLWDPRFGQRKHGAVAWTPVSNGVQDVYRDGDELVAVRHLHKQWSSTCNVYSDVRADGLRAAREAAGDNLREAVKVQISRGGEQHSATRSSMSSSTRSAATTSRSRLPDVSTIRSSSRR
mmetsp:Transcript_36542/g.58712  ORF Transcript_36542/g.58712 Transcript_36542/m.58712 type:complete len:175 (-) Transcript_36542:1125-1649(-)